jgi:hypothetical protein
MGALRRMRTWTSIGLLLMAAGLPYCAAALSWGVTTDETSISVRADIAFGVALALLGVAVLAAVLALWAVRRALRRWAPEMRDRRVELS